MNQSSRHNVHLTRARHLMSQSRYEPAIKELHQHLSESPDDAVGYGMLGVAHAHLGNKDDSIRFVNRAVELGPNIAYCHWARAATLRQAESYSEAESAALEALRLSAQNAAYYSMLGQIRFSLRNWKGTLEAAKAGLTVDPRHSSCLNLQALALLRLGEKDNADSAISSALSQNPEDAVTHANQGWICLGRGDHEKALTHFKEALRINPSIDTAGRGILESLAHRYATYRIIYAYNQWLASRSLDTRRAVVLTGLAVCCAIPFITPHPLMVSFAVLYAILLFLTWTGRSLFDLVLRFDPLGRMVLTPQQITASNWVLLCLVAGIVSVVLGLDGKWVPLISAGCFMVLAFKGAAIARIKGPFQRNNIFCAVIYAATAAVEAAGLITKDDIGWPLFALLVVILPAVVYGGMTVGNRQLSIGAAKK